MGAAAPAIYGLVGGRLGHSLSADYHRRRFARLGIAADYLTMEMEDVTALRGLIRACPGLRGLNVTIPYKEAVIPLLDSLDPVAAQIGAVNTIVVHPDGRLTGRNTDAPAFAASLRQLLPQGPARALVLGAGGASRAVCWALRELLGCQDVQVVSRHPGRLPGALGYSDLTAQDMARWPLVVNATPLGTAAGPFQGLAPELPYEGLGPDNLCYDLVYNPPLTPFMRLSSQAGARAVNGLDMLHRQADASWTIWNNANPAPHR